MKHRLLTAVFAVACAAASPAAAFELLRVNGNPCNADRNLFWKDARVAVSAIGLPDAFQPLAVEARNRWNQSQRGFEFTGGLAPPCTVDGIASLGFSDQTCSGAAFDGDIVALTRSIWRTNGELVDADVLFKTNGQAARNDDVFLEVAMHELGHVLGLDHSDACGASGAGTLMKASLDGTRILFPQADDVEGAEFVYPVRGGGGVPEGANSCAIVPPPGRGPAFPFVVMAILLAARVLLRRGNASQND
jgi:hypothetical protein